MSKYEFSDIKKRFPNVLDEKYLHQLDEEGFLLLPRNEEYFRQDGTYLSNMRNILDDLVEKEGTRGGWEGQEFVLEREPRKLADPGSNRIANLLNKDMCFIKLITMPDVLVATYHLFQDEFKISAMSLREPLKGCGLQKLHIDWKPREDASKNFECLTCYFAVDDTNVDNGALSLIPGTHKKNEYPDEFIDPGDKHPDEIFVELKAGDCAILNSLVWHRGNINKSGQRRRTIFTEFRNRKLSQGLNQQLYISDEVKNKFDDFEKWIVAVGKAYPTDQVRQLGAGAFYRKKYQNKLAHEINEA